MSARARAALVSALALAVAFPAARGARAGALPDWVETARARSVPEWASRGDAVVLHDEQVVTAQRSGRVVTVQRWAVRVLGPTGADAARIQTSYVRGESSVRSLHAWQVDPAGRASTLGEKDAVDFSAANGMSLYSDVRIVRLAARDALPGTFFAGEVVLEQSPLLAQWAWWFDGLRPSLLSRFTLELPAGPEPVARFGTGRQPAATHADGRWCWELDDNPARRDEALAPVALNHGACVLVSLRAPQGAAAAEPAFGAAFDTWADVGTWLDRLESAPCALTPAIRDHAHRVVGALADTLGRLAALARDVQALNYVAIDVGIARGFGYRPHPADAVLAAGYGDCKDKANLLCALLRADGHDAWMVSAYAGNPDHVDADWPTPMQFNHAIVVMRVPAGTPLPAVFEHPRMGTLLPFDPTDPCTAFGDLPQHEQGSLALVDLPRGAELLRLPVEAPEARAFTRTIEAELSAAGALHAHVIERSAGQAAATERGLRRETDKYGYRRMLETWLAAAGPSIELGEYATDDDSLAGTFRLEVTYAAPHFARPAAGRLLTLRGAPLAWPLPPPMPDSARVEPLALPARCERESVTVRIPEGFVPDDLPAPVDRTTDFGSFHAAWTASAGQLHFTRSLRVEGSRWPAARYRDVRAFYDMARAAQRAAVVLVGQQPAAP